MNAKQLAQNVVARLGYELRRNMDAFAVQRDLIGRDDPVIFDVGANIGTVATAYRALFPSATVHCFEPGPDTFRALKANKAGDPKVFAHDLALCDREGVVSFNHNAAPATNSLLATDERANASWGGTVGVYETRETIEVRTTTIDAFCDANGIDRVDVLKMDIQGAEYDALRGASRMLTEKRVSLVYIEIIMVPTYVGQHSLAEYLTLLDGFGYELFDFYDPTRKRGRLAQADGLFIGGEALERFRDGPGE